MNSSCIAPVGNKEKSFMNMRTYRLKINFQSAAQSFLSKNSPKPTKPKIIILKTNSIFFFVNLEVDLCLFSRRLSRVTVADPSFWHLLIRLVNLESSSFYCRLWQHTFELFKVQDNHQKDRYTSTVTTLECKNFKSRSIECRNFKSRSILTCKTSRNRFWLCHCLLMF